MNLKNINFNGFSIILIIVGILLRIIMFSTRLPAYDGIEYMAIGHGFSQTFTFIEPWGNFADNLQNTPEYTKLAPLFPAYLGFFYMLFGFSIKITQIATFVLSIVMLLVVYLTTKDLLGHQKGLIITAIIALDYTLIYTMAMGHAESLLVIIIAILTWSLLKGLNNSKYLPIVGVSIGLFYLTKSHSLKFIYVVLLILAFIIWRYCYVNKMVFKDKNYLLMYGIGLGIPGLWRLRNYLIAPESSEIMNNIPIHFSSDFIMFLFLKAIWIFLLVAVVFVFWIPELSRIFKNFKIERYNALILIVIGYSLMAWFVSSTALISDINVKSWLFRENHIRYLVPIYVPLLWLIFSDIDFKQQISSTSIPLRIRIQSLLRDRNRLILFMLVLIVSILVKVFLYNWLAIIIFFGAISLLMKNPKKRLGFMLVAFLIISINTVSNPVQLPHVEAGKYLNTVLRDEDTITINGFAGDYETYDLYPYIYNYNIKPIFNAKENNTTYILSYLNTNYEGYTLIGEYYWGGSLNVLSEFKTLMKETLKGKPQNKKTKDESKPSLWLWKKIR